jgi:hypothetical protein
LTQHLSDDVTAVEFHETSIDRSGLKGSPFPVQGSSPPGPQACSLCLGERDEIWL